MSSLSLYLASDPRARLPMRLIVARSTEQAAAMSTEGMDVSKATVFQAFRCGKLNLTLEYANPRYKEST